MKPQLRTDLNPWTQMSLDGDQVVCRFPADVRGQSLRSLEPSRLDCPPSIHELGDQDEDCDSSVEATPPSAPPTERHPATEDAPPTEDAVHDAPEEPGLVEESPPVDSQQDTPTFGDTPTIYAGRFRLSKRSRKRRLFQNEHSNRSLKLFFQEPSLVEESPPVDSQQDTPTFGDTPTIYAGRFRLS